eukprot:jgi/Mesvir1/27061/Mv24240-RA.1
MASVVAAALSLSAPTCAVAPTLPQRGKLHLRPRVGRVTSLKATSARLPVICRLGEERGAALLEKPGLDRTGSDTKPVVETGGAGQQASVKKGSELGGMWRLVLVDSERHSENKVASVLPAVVPNCTPEDARACFRTSRLLGWSLICLCLKEHAEFYQLMAYKGGLKTRIEPDTDTV